MYLTAKRYEGVIDPQEVGRRISDGLAGLISQLPGFVSFYCAEADDNIIVTTSVFETRSNAEESDRRSTAWSRENIGFLSPNSPQVTTGEVVATGRRVT